MTETTKHRWHVMNSHIQGGKTIFQPRDDEGVDVICEVPPFIGNETIADLIATAPELLEACQSAMVLSNCLGSGNTTISPTLDKLVCVSDLLRHAITKATQSTTGAHI